MKNGLYLVNHKGITAAFVMRDDRVTVCAPILRREIEYWKTKATWYPTDPTLKPVGEPLPVPDDS